MESAYERTFKARVVALPPGGIVLDRTYFYAVGGGQPADRGELHGEHGASWKVADVAKVGPAIVHRLGRPRSPTLPRVGDELEGRIDWTRRYAHMRSHSAQHLLSARAFAMTGLRTRKATIGAERGTLELEAAWPTRPSLDDLRADMARHIAAAEPVHIRFVPRAEYDREPGARSGLVPLAPQIDPVRVIEIESADRCPCGGTHVRNTSEIGAFDLVNGRPVSDGAYELNFTLGPPATATPTA